MTSIGLVANNYTIVDPDTLQQANINYVNNLISTDKDMFISTQYNNLSLIPNGIVPVAGLVNSAISNLQTQINNIGSSSNIVTINNIGLNKYSLSGLVGSQNIVFSKMQFY